MPRQLAAWENYIRVVVGRYKGRIDAYEVWNEPNQRGMFSGSIADMATLADIAYRTVKSVDPAAVVVSPSPARGREGVAWMREYLRAGGLSHVDVIGFHPYMTNGTPEETATLVSGLMRVLSADGSLSHPVWITELGWFIQNREKTVAGSADPVAFDHTVLSDTVAAAYVARALALGWCSGAQRLMWYAWDNGRMGLLDSDRQTEKLAATAYRTMAAWMRGATFTGCTRSSAGDWTIEIRRADGDHQQILWNERGGGTGPAASVTVLGTALVPANASSNDSRLATQRGIPILVAAPTR